MNNKTNIAIYALWHTHILENGDEDIKFLGFFSKKEKALKAIERYKILPGFKEFPNQFDLCQYELNECHWKEGFTTSFIGGK
ncbi:MAG: hypothetical protein J6M21_07780 [Campylobacter sp.]|nr:hypothetical protein [Campylobacter sp.]